MNDFIHGLVIVAAVACMYLGQSRRVAKSSQRTFSLLAIASCVVIAVEAAAQNQMSTVVLFSLAALVSAFALAMDLLKPSNPDA